MTSRWFGDYEIIRQLRIGGMATLYLARRHGAAGFSRLVTLKMIHPNLVAQPGLIEMFVDEARICSQISHPNVVHVEEFGVLDGAHYLVMEYVDGCSLTELLQVYDRQHRKLDPEIAAGLVAQVAGGLHAAHETRDQDGQPLEIIHRDISQSNILLSVAGGAKLIDFGIAKARNRMSETQTPSLKGKYKYVAPEQATGAPVDRRCDVFSLGVVFWELLVGKPLFTEDSAVALFRRLHRTDALPPSTLNPEVPTVLDWIVLAMLQHDPARRLQTAAEVQRRIMQAVPGAANRVAAELGALAIDVRDQRAAHRAAQRAAGEPIESSNHISFSPTPRSQRTSVGQPDDDGPNSSAPDLPKTAHRRLRRRRSAIILGLAIVLVFGMIGRVLLADRRPQRTAPTTMVSNPPSNATDTAAGAKNVEQPAPTRATADLTGKSAAATGATSSLPLPSEPGKPLATPPEHARPDGPPTEHARPDAPSADRAHLDTSQRETGRPDAPPPERTRQDPPSELMRPGAPPPERARQDPGAAPADSPSAPAKPSVAVKQGLSRGRPPTRPPAGKPSASAAPPARAAAPGAGRGPAIIRGFDPEGDGTKPDDSAPVLTKPPIVPGFDERTSE